MAQARRLNFRAADQTLYGRALELAVRGKPAGQRVPITYEELDAVLPEARRIGKRQGWFNEKPGSRTNAADIFHAFGGRRKSFPQTLRGRGYTETREVNGKWYLWKARHPPQVELPDPDTLRAIKIRDLVPDTVRDLVPPDEQGLLARTGESNVLAMFLGVQATVRIAAHWKGGGAEMDEVHCALAQGQVVLVPVEAKGKREALVRHQIANAVGRLRSLHPGKAIRPVGLKAIADEEIVLVEFNATDDPDELKIKRLKKYRFVDPD
jgi:hypothetical protein